jgi:hypothetical protein
MPELGYDINRSGRNFHSPIGAENIRLDPGLAGQPARRVWEWTVAIPRYDSVGWPPWMVQPEEQEEDRADRQLDQLERQSAFYIHVGVDPRYQDMRAVESSATIINSSQHPALRSVNNTCLPTSHDGFHTPPEVPSPLKTGVVGQNQL